MPKVIKSTFARIGETLQFPADLFSISPGGMRYRPITRHVMTTEEAWRKDWENIGKSFRAAVDQVMQDRVAYGSEPEPDWQTEGRTLDDLKRMLISLRTDIREMIADGT